jgi:hypothetical protein
LTLQASEQNISCAIETNARTFASAGTSFAFSRDVSALCALRGLFAVKSTREIKSDPKILETVGQQARNHEHE